MRYRYNKRRTNKRRYRVTLRSKIKKERRKRFGTLVLFILSISVLSGIIWYGGKSAYNIIINAECFKIKNIDISGCKNITKSEILALLPYRKGDSVLCLSFNNIEKSILEYKSEIKNISIRRGWKRLIVKVVEREPVGLVKVNNKLMCIDYENKTFPIRGHLIDESLPEIVYTTENERMEILKFMRLLKTEAKDIYRDIVNFSLESNGMVFKLKDGLKVFWGIPDKTEIGLKLQWLNRVLNDARSRFQGVEYINLIFINDGRIIIKPKKDILIHKI